jgi:polyhydroxyalkanoate synthesis regulator phasin
MNLDTRKDGATMRASARIGVIVVLALVWGCERSEPTGGAGGNAATQPAATQPATSGGTLEDMKQKGQQAAEMAARIIREVRQKYQQQAVDELARCDEQIKVLREKLTQATDEARPELEKRVEELSRRVQDARALLEQANAASDEAWKGLTGQFDAAFSELKRVVGAESAASQPATEPTTQPAAQPTTQPAAATKPGPAGGRVGPAKAVKPAPAKKNP